jgi:NADH-quinone oxidoreductase subunit M
VTVLLTIVVLLPVAVATVLVAARGLRPRAVSTTWIGAAAVDLAVIAWMWVRYDPATQQGTLAEGIAYETKVRWIPPVDASYHVGVDGISLPLLALTGVLFLAVAVWSAARASMSNVRSSEPRKRAMKPTSSAREPTNV